MDPFGRQAFKETLVKTSSLTGHLGEFLTTFIMGIWLWGLSEHDVLYVAFVKVEEPLEMGRVPLELYQ